VNSLHVVTQWTYVTTFPSRGNYTDLMQNASKNAGDMIGKYQILFNRTRQAVITGELVEIITGAAASEE
jgi:hypothetical protein